MTRPDDSVRKAIDGTVHPRMADQEKYLAASGSSPIPVARADLLYFWDEYRTEYLDFAALRNPVGHSHPMVAQAVAGHARYYGLTAPQGQHLLRWPVEYAKQLSACFTGREEQPRKVLFCEGEREAVIQAVRLASAGKPVAVLDTGWHDWLPGETRRITPAAWSGIEWEGLGALLLAPVTTAAHPILGVREMILLARTAGVPVIIDESVTGFGRLGSLWGQEKTGLIADLTVLGGPAGGGYPLGAVIAPPDFFADPIDVSPLSGHPVACSAGKHTLDVISFGVLEYMEESSQVLDKGLTELAEQFPHYLAGHHGQGLLWGLRFRPGYAGRFPLSSRSHGLHVGPAVGDTIVLAPVLITSTVEMRRAVDLIAATLMSWDDGDVT